MRLISLIILPVALALPAYTGGETEWLAGWSCRNMDVEISCDGGVCEASESFTPMDISVADTDMTVCAYSGCWEGPPSQVTKNGRFETYVGTALSWSNNMGSVVDASVTVDTATGTATILVADMYATPGICTRFAAGVE